METSSGVSQDSYSPSSDGFLCVKHVPDCKGWIFSSGNSGTDKFFDESHPLPPGASVDGVLFAQYWPQHICASGSGGLGGYGSYGARLDGAGPHPTNVNWNNSCQSDFGDKDLHYKISFIVTMIKGTDMAEPVFTDVNSADNSCQPAGYVAFHPTTCTPAPGHCSTFVSPGPQTVTIAKVVTSGQIIYPYTLSINNGCSGKLLSVNNPTINDGPVLIKTASGRVTLATGSSTTLSDNSTLFGANNPALPVTITISLPTGQTPAGIYMVMNYTYYK